MKKAVVSASCYLSLKLIIKLDHATSTHYSIKLKCHATLCNDLRKKQFMLPLSEIPAFWGDATSQQNPIKLSVMLLFVKFCENSTSCYSLVQKPASINSCYPCKSSITFSVSCYLCIKLGDKLCHATSTNYSIKPKCHATLLNDYIFG